MSPGKWLEPTVDSILERLSKEGKKYILIAPIGFVSDHIETLYDIDIVYKGMAKSLGMKFHRTNSLNDSPKFIEVLAKVIRKTLKNRY
jgi:ferrochelatase